MRSRTLTVKHVPTLHMLCVASLACASPLNSSVTAILNVQTGRMRTSTTVIKHTLRTILWNHMPHTDAKAPSTVEWTSMLFLVIIEENAWMVQERVSKFFLRSPNLKKDIFFLNLGVHQCQEFLSSYSAVVLFVCQALRN